MLNIYLIYDFISSGEFLFDNKKGESINDFIQRTKTKFYMDNQGTNLYVSLGKEYKDTYPIITFDFLIDKLNTKYPGILFGG